MKKLLILLLALCLCPLAAWAEPAAQMEYDSHFIEEMFAANTREAVLARHESVNITIERFYLYNFSIYMDRSGVLYQATPGNNNCLTNAEGRMFDLNPDGEEMVPKLTFFAMTEEEKDARLTKLVDVSMVHVLTLEEELCGITDNGDGTLTVITRASAETFAKQGETYPDDLTGLPQESIYTLDKETLEILYTADYLLRGDEKIPITASTMAFDVPPPAEIEKLEAMQKKYGNGPADPHYAWTLIVVYDEGTDAEQRFSIQADMDIQMALELHDGYRLVSSEGDYNADGTGYTTVCYAGPVE